MTRVSLLFQRLNNILERVAALFHGFDFPLQLIVALSGLAQVALQGCEQPGEALALLVLLGALLLEGRNLRLGGLQVVLQPLDPRRLVVAGVGGLSQCKLEAFVLLANEKDGFVRLLKLGTQRLRTLRAGPQRTDVLLRFEPGITLKIPLTFRFLFLLLQTTDGSGCLLREWVGVVLNTFRPRRL